VSEDFPVLAGFRAGSLVAGYRLDAQVGAGGMAVVFRARDERLGRLVALKILSPALAADPTFRRRFIAESRAAAAVDDPHIIPVFEAGEAGGVLFIAMRFVAGGDLRSVLDREGPLPPGRAAGFLSPVASALDAAHRAGLVHRDVKPANILVDARPDRPDHVYLSDFGVSKGAVSSVSLAGTGHFLGTPDYSAPEQIQGRAVDGRTDQYALACVAFQLLTGTAPFERDQGMAVLLAHLSEPPPSVCSRRPDLPAVVDPVLAQAMAKVPEKRYGSCRDFADALRGALGLPPYASPGLAWAPGHPPTEPGTPGAEFSALVPAMAAEAVGLPDPAAALTVDSAPGGGPAGVADVSPAVSGATGHLQDPPVIPRDTSLSIATPGQLIAGGGIVAAAVPANEAEPGVVSKLVGISGLEAAELADGSDLTGRSEAERTAAGSSDASSAGTGQEADVVRGQHAFPSAPAATGPGAAMPGAVVAEPAVIGDGVAEDGTTDARITGAEAAETVLSSLILGLGPATDPGLEPDTCAASQGNASRPHGSAIAGLRRGLDVRRPPVLAAAAVLVVAVGLGSWLSLSAGASHTTGARQHNSQPAEALAGTTAADPSLPVTISSPVTTPTTHPATHKATRITRATTQPVTVHSTTPPGPQIFIIPDTIGETEARATQVLEADGFNVQVNSLGGSGRVYKVWDYSPVGYAPRGTTILIDVLAFSN
jgi:hypothetical protein